MLRFFIKHLRFCICLLFFLMWTACTSYTPKPKTYIYIELPKKEYIDFDSASYPFTFRLPSYASFSAVKGNTWSDIIFPSLGATINITYIAQPHLDSCIANSLFFVDRNLNKANGMHETPLYDSARHIHGYIYDLRGPDVASTCQFYITDSNLHFVRGSLYLNCIPNNDSLAPVLEFLRADIDTILSSWRWKVQK